MGSGRCFCPTLLLRISVSVALVNSRNNDLSISTSISRLFQLLLRSSNRLGSLFLLYLVLSLQALFPLDVDKGVYTNRTSKSILNRILSLSHAPPHFPPQSIRPKKSRRFCDALSHVSMLSTQIWHRPPNAHKDGYARRNPDFVTHTGKRFLIALIRQ
ncbi:hypothetical protein BCV70DRAFT_77422 [Testicularia cyperi]|uniref:Uncharacterized protein n=1 Tax=Testicularia cyperi TaxID=1882483 RepID=A0A317XUR8_9BASI|nr:hypothetical protein BCV70DRAFT_77422 [Testicularia cyperi]